MSHNDLINLNEKIRTIGMQFQLFRSKKVYWTCDFANRNFTENFNDVIEAEKNRYKVLLWDYTKVFFIKFLTFVNIVHVWVFFDFSARHYPPFSLLSWCQWIVQITLKLRMYFCVVFYCSNFFGECDESHIKFIGGNLNSLIGKNQSNLVCVNLLGLAWSSE